jgi:glucose-1-phosphate cytidylyltransferase
MGSIPAVILCGGLGTRLREETEYRPKPMVEVGGRPILWHLLRIFARQGVRDFILCLGYRGDVIRRYFLEYEAMNSDVTVDLGSKRITVHDHIAEGDWRITLAETGPKAQTGARIARVRRYVEGRRFFATYGDGLANVDLRALLRHHEQEGRLATLTAVHHWSGRFGELVLSGGRVSSFREKPIQTRSYINGGFFVFEPGVFDYLSDDDSCVLEQEPFERLTSANQMAAYQHGSFWACLDTPRDHLALNEMCERGERPWEVPA